LTYPEVGTFLTTYVAGTTSINYEEYFAKVGVTKTTVKAPENVFLNGQVPYITVKQETKEIMILPEIELNDFMKALDLKGNDIVTAINGTKYDLSNIYEMITKSQEWKEGEAITVAIKRDGKELTLTGKVKLSYKDAEGYKSSDTSKTALKNAWLKG